MTTLQPQGENLNMKISSLVIVLLAALFSFACQTEPVKKTQATVENTPTPLETPYRAPVQTYTPSSTPDLAAEKAKLVTELKESWAKIDSVKLDEENPTNDSPSWKAEAMKSSAIKTDALKLAYQQIERYDEFIANYDEAQDQIALLDIDLTQEMVDRKLKEKVSKYISALQALPKSSFEEVCFGGGEGGSPCLTDSFDVLNEIMNIIEVSKLKPTDVGWTPEKIRTYAKQVFDANLKNAAKDETLHAPLCEMTKEWKFSLPTTMTKELAEQITTSCD